MVSSFLSGIVSVRIKEPYLLVIWYTGALLIPYIPTPTFFQNLFFVCDKNNIVVHTVVHLQPFL
jgi:hypothetical protein